MSYTVHNFLNNDDAKVIASCGNFQVIQWDRDPMVTPSRRKAAWLPFEMDVRCRRLVIDLDGNTGATLQTGIMQWAAGSESAVPDVRGDDDMTDKAADRVVHQGSAIKPEYTGKGRIVCRPTSSHIVLIDTSEWLDSVVLDDNLFLACDNTLSHELQRYSNRSTHLTRRMRFYNLRIDGSGTLAIESPCPKSELFYVDLNNDILRVEDDYVLMWTSTLDYYVEQSCRPHIGSSISGETLVNVYRGSGRVILAPRPLRKQSR